MDKTIGVEEKQTHSDTTQMTQQDLPLALVRGELVIDRPQDLFIPPDALEVFLEAFEGPLDFLLYLIKKQKFDIVDLPVFEITKQYMEYVEVMRKLKLELAAEYLVMAAMLAEIKSRLLLPKHDFDEEVEEDPRAELIRRLQEYEVIKNAAAELDCLPREDREVFNTQVETPDSVQPTLPDTQVSLQDLVTAFQSVVKRINAFQHHEISKERLSTRDRMSQILTLLQQDKGFVDFVTLFDISEGTPGAVVTFLAVLELVKENLIDVIQSSAFSQIHVKYREAEV